ncbi:alpha/beta fold hydrolase [Prochlorococcus marinus]|uniref:Alpha/beta hydrolase n=1 Tax=Prochlorococcus marinus XMU1408 TaxID=2213228 RepID=A0A318R217_PROMR|nr:alpha/beta hydrolase [Prochlorococcus marinus]MBW3042268.1 alpha/beta hydrolase [Prochlorococcus marinus str. XMU1408]PYE01656.1 alpha/beta hydrolase [Prochlorococcus marinus XMU1408]
MNKERSNHINPTNASKAYIKNIKDQIIDKQASRLFEDLNWIKLKGISCNESDLFPAVITGRGKKILLLHGFDSCFLEYRRLTPFLKKNNKLIIPDLYGFGFCPRSRGNKYGFKYLIKHLNSVLDLFSDNQPIGVIGASMGGALALELARQNPKRVDKLLLLSPAGLVGKNPKIPWPLNHFGAFFLSQTYVRRGLCRQAFAHPTKSVGPAEEQIASIHLKVPGWESSLADFAAQGGVSDCGLPKPTQPLKIILGKHDRIIPKNEKEKTNKIYNSSIQIATNSGHLPHLEEPQLVAETWKNFK